MAVRVAINGFILFCNLWNRLTKFYQQIYSTQFVPKVQDEFQK